jgi:hypothetical protein
MSESKIQPEFKVGWDNKPTVCFPHPASKFKEAWKWCEENCTGKWYICVYNHFFFYFENKNDAVLFKSAWA